MTFLITVFKEFLMLLEAVFCVLVAIVMSTTTTKLFYYHNHNHSRLSAEFLNLKYCYFNVR